MLQNPWLAELITFAIFAGWMITILSLRKRKIISGPVSRKIIHIGTGIIFLLCWLLFPEESISRYLAAFIPLLITIMLIFTGKGLIKNEMLTNAMTRNGEKWELLRGPLLYGLVFVLMTVIFWKSIHAVIALTILCAGDGSADIIGSRFGTRVLPWSKKKTIVGSLAMVIIGGLSSLLMIYAFTNHGVISGNLNLLIIPVFLISLVATIVESFSPSDIDNITVPLSSVIASVIILSI